MATFFTGVDGLGSVFWQSLDIADAIALVNTNATVVSASSTNGLWTITLDPTGGAASARAFWRFAWPAGSPPGNDGQLYVRFLDFTAPASNEDISVAVGLGDGTSVTEAVGYQYITATTNMRVETTLDNWTPAAFGSATAQGPVTRVDGRISGSTVEVWANAVGGASGVLYSDDNLGSQNAEIAIAVRNAGGTQQTLSFRPQIAVVDLGSIQG